MQFIMAIYFVHLTDVAMKLFQKYPLELAIARDEHNLTAMHMLVQKPWEVLSKLISILVLYLEIYASILLYKN